MPDIHQILNKGWLWKLSFFGREISSDLKLVTVEKYTEEYEAPYFENPL